MAAIQGCLGTGKGSGVRCLTIGEVQDDRDPQFIAETVIARNQWVATPRKTILAGVRVRWRRSANYLSQIKLPPNAAAIMAARPGATKCNSTGHPDGEAVHRVVEVSLRIPRDIKRLADALVVSRTRPDFVVAADWEFDCR